MCNYQLTRVNEKKNEPKWGDSLKTENLHLKERQIRGFNSFSFSFSLHHSDVNQNMQSEEKQTVEQLIKYVLPSKCHHFNENWQQSAQKLISKLKCLFGKERRSYYSIDMAISVRSGVSRASNGILESIKKLRQPNELFCGRKGSKSE